MVVKGSKHVLVQVRSRSGCSLSKFSKRVCGRGNKLVDIEASANQREDLHRGRDRLSGADSRVRIVHGPYPKTFVAT